MQNYPPIICTERRKQQEPPRKAHSNMQFACCCVLFVVPLCREFNSLQRGTTKTVKQSRELNSLQRGATIQPDPIPITPWHRSSVHSGRPLALRLQCPDLRRLTVDWHLEVCLIQSRQFKILEFGSIIDDPNHYVSRTAINCSPWRRRVVCALHLLEDSSRPWATSIENYLFSIMCGTVASTQD